VIRRISLVKKPAATKAPAKKPAALKHIAAEIAESHEVSKTRAESMLTDTVDRLAKHLVKGAKVCIVGLGISQVKRREARMAAIRRPGKR
jgi:DNA-binding protein HU-beta